MLCFFSWSEPVVRFSPTENPKASAQKSVSFLPPTPQSNCLTCSVRGDLFFRVNIPYDEPTDVMACSLFRCNRDGSGQTCVYDDDRGVRGQDGEQWGRSASERTLE